MDVFLFNLVMILSKNTNINKYTVKSIKSKQSLYSFIYIFSLVKLEILKTYIKTHLKTRFILYFKSLASISIFFNNKLDNSFHLYINY